jgi:hypothetical protein
MTCRRRRRQQPQESAIAPFTSIRHAYMRAELGEEDAQRCLIGCLSNLGCDHLADQRGQVKAPRWRRYYFGLIEYIGSLVGEYGESEYQAENDVLAELNMARTYSDGIDLND